MTGPGPPERGIGSPASIDRILVGCCAGIWLTLIGVSVAAVVALVDLGRGVHAAGNPRTGLLYVVIGVSALIIVAAIPVLIRARSTAAPRAAARAVGAATHRGYAATQSGDQRGDQYGTAVVAIEPIPPAAVDRIWLRGAASLGCAIGAALVAVAAATYLMAVGKEAASWAGYGVAGLITAVMPVIPWLQLRQLRQLSSPASQPPSR